MHIICPNCGLKSPVETGGLAVETRLVCTRCEVEVEIKFTDEPGAEDPTKEIALFESFAETLEEKLGLPAAATQSEAEPGDVLGLDSLPTPPAAAEEVWEPENLVLEEAQPVEAQPVVVVETQLQPEAIESPARTRADEEDGEDVTAVSSIPEYTYERASARAAQNFDKYNVGVRLMQASPVWLLVSGLSFISFIVLCNWFFVPNNLAQAEPQRPSARANQAMNLAADQSVAPTALPASPADEAADASADAQPATRPVETPAPTAEQPSPPQPAPTSSPIPATPQPAAPAAVASAPAEPAREQSAGSSSAAEGKFTLQVGSYNVAAEAEARAKSLQAAGVEARVAQVEIPKRGTWYRVQAGRFASREEAERAGRQLREKNLAASYLTAAL